MSPKDVIALALSACLVAFIGVHGDATKYAHLKQQVFDFGSTLYSGEEVGYYINQMIGCLEDGDVPASRQGQLSLEFFKSLVADCTVGAACDLTTDIGKLRRLNGLETQSLNLDTYTSMCRAKIFNRCESDLHKVTNFDQQSLKVIKEVALQVYGARREQLRQHRY